jgi:hypothetical protein
MRDLVRGKMWLLLTCPLAQAPDAHQFLALNWRLAAAQPPRPRLSQQGQLAIFRCCGKLGYD